MSVNLILVRHGATKAGDKGIILSHIDGHLNELGERQAKELATKLSRKRIDAIYSSPLSRAFGTAKPLSEKLNLPIIKDSRIIEVNMGSFSGQPLDSTKEVFDLSCVPLMDSYEFDITPYNGESNEQVKERVQSFLNDMAKLKNKTIAVFTHDGTLHWFYLLCAGKKVVGQPNASIHEFSI